MSIIGDMYEEQFYARQSCSHTKELEDENRELRRLSFEQLSAAHNKGFAIGTKVTAKSEISFAISKVMQFMPMDPDSDAHIRMKQAISKMQERLEHVLRCWKD